MKVVNLSRRPFLNDRPVKRFAAILWVLGGLLLLVNLWLYGSYFSGTSKGQGRLEVLARQIDQEQDDLEELSQELRALKLGVRNDRAEFLNTLIDARTFPWSALFDALEEVMPIDAFLISVKPNVLKDERPKAKRRTRARTAREARARARERRSGNTRNSEPEVVTKKIDSEDRVLLALQVNARNEEAMFELLDNFYKSPAFEKPILKKETADAQRNVGSTIDVVYLPPKPGVAPPEEGMPGSEVLADAEPRTGAAAGTADGAEAPRQVARAANQERTGLPPEEEVGAGSEGLSRPPLPSRASVAPALRDRGAKPEANTGGKAPRGRTVPNRRVAPTGRSTPGGVQRERPSGPRTRQTADRPRARNPAAVPTPVVPSASSSPRLRGSLIDGLLPRWAPAGPSQAAPDLDAWTLASLDLEDAPSMDSESGDDGPGFVLVNGPSTRRDRLATAIGAEARRGAKARMQGRHPMAGGEHPPWPRETREPGRTRS